jgi:hypothetical protein
MSIARVHAFKETWFRIIVNYISPPDDDVLENVSVQRAHLDEASLDLGGYTCACRF